MAALICCLVAGLVPAAAGAAPTDTKQLTMSNQLADQLLVRVNALRASVGSPPLARDPSIDAFALGWSVTMANSAGLMHNPNLRQIPGRWHRAGENVGVGTQLNSMFDAFVRSPHHYPNLVDPTFTLTGIAVVFDSAGELWVTQDFQQPMTQGPAVRRPAATAATVAPAPTPPAAPELVEVPVLPTPPPTLPSRISFALRALGGPDPNF